MDSLAWLREYKPWADQTLRASGDTLPLVERLRECAEALASAQSKLSSESKRADDMMHRGDSWREMCDELEAKLKGQSLRLDSALGALTEIFQLADGISDDMTLPEIGTIALGAIQKPLVEIPAPISHVGCVLCDGSGWKDIMIGAETKRLPCSGPIPVPLE